MNPNIRLTILIALLAALSACGGGGGASVDSGGIGGTGVVSTGVMTKGSIVLNSVHFDDSNVNNVSDDPLGGTSGEPDDGKVVKLRGRRNDDGITGTAETVEVENEVRGTVESTDDTTSPQSFVVVNQTVTIDDLTICKNFTLPASSVGAPTFRCDDPLPELGSGTVVVEVHGLRLADGSIRASRIEKLGIGAGTGFDELRGIVDSMTATGFILKNGSATVTVINNSGTLAALLQLVEIHGTYNSATNEFTATRVDIEDLEDDEFKPENNGEIEREGFVGDCGAPGCTTFTVSGAPVQTTSDVRYENGDANDLVNGVRIEAEGHFVTSSGTLMADKIKFKRVRVELTGDATITGGGNLIKGGTLAIMGIAIKTDQTTSLDPRGGAITTGEPVEVRGYLDSSNEVLAVEVKELSSTGDEVIRGPVTAKGTDNVTIVGILVNLASATQFQDGAIPTLSQFMSLITAAPSPGGTVVKAKGSFAGGTLNADEAEIED